MLVRMEFDDLVRTVLAGDERASTELGRRLTAELNPLFVRLGDPDANELTQITLLIIYRRLPELALDPARPFLHWVRAIARMQAKLAHRQRDRARRRLEMLAQIMPPTTPGLSSRFARAELLALVERALVELDSPYRRVLENDLEGGDIDEFARREGIVRATVRTRRRRAIAQLRRRLWALIEGDRPSASNPP